MKRLTVIGLVSLLAYGALLVAKWDSSPSAPLADAAAGKAGVAADARPDRRPAGSLPADAPASAGSRLAGMPLPSPVVVQAVKRLSPVASEFRSTRDLKAFAEALAARKSHLTGDERFHLAKALESCLFANSVNEDLASYSAKQRRQFVASLPAGDASAAQRLAAYDAVDDAFRCLRFHGAKISPREIDELFTGAAQTGDPRAQARLLAGEIQRNFAAQPRDENGAPSRIAADDLARIVAILETGDPEAVLSVGGLLAQSPLKEQLRVGPSGEVPEPTAFIGAWQLVACDLGLDCGAQHRDLQQACAFAAYCGAGHFEEHYQTFVASPFVYQQAQRYRALIHGAMQSRDWAQIGLGAKLAAAPKTPKP